MLVFNNNSRGDTLIEVLFAITVFSLVVVGSVAIMNQGTATAQRALEISLVRDQIDAQAETLRFLNASYIAAYPNISSGTPAAEWQKIVLQNEPQPSVFGDCSVISGSGYKPFILNTKTAKLENTSILTSNVQTYAQLQYDIPPNDSVAKSADGIWIEAIKSATTDNSNHQANAGYVDFHIRACWNGPGQSVPITMGTIVRLYEPR